MAGGLPPPRTLQIARAEALQVRPANMPEHTHTPRPQSAVPIYALFGGATASLRARVGLGLTFPPHASTAHFSAPIMFTALNTNAFGKTSASLGAAAESGEAEVVLLIAASGGQRMAMRECRPAPQRPLQSRSGSVLPARAPCRGALGTGRRRAAPTCHLGVIQQRPPLSLLPTLA